MKAFSIIVSFVSALLASVQAQSSDKLDLQVGLAAAVRDWDATIYKNAIFAHAGVGLLYDLPVVLTTSVEVGPNGPLPKEILEMYPSAPYIARLGEVDAWDNEDFRAAVKATGKKQMIIAGITTDVCVTQLALSLRAEGYHVAVNLEASGTFNQRVADAALMRMQAAGVQIMNFFSINAELFRDASCPAPLIRRCNTNSAFSWRHHNPSPDQTIPFLDHFLAEESWVVRSHAAAVNEGIIVAAGENVTITPNATELSCFAI